MGLLRFEWVKWLQSRRMLGSSAVVVLYLGLMLLGFYTYAQTETGGQAEFRYTFENRGYFNGLTFGLYGFYFGALLVLPIFAVAEGGIQLAGEVHRRTLPLLLFRPISRSQIFLGKFLIAFFYQSLLVGFLLFAALSLGLVFVGWGELNIYPGVLQMADTHQRLTQGEALFSFFCAWLAAALAMSVPLSMSFLLSTWLKNPINVVATSSAVYLVLLVVSEIHFFRDLRPYLFTTHMGFWRELFRQQIPWRLVVTDGSKLLAFGLGFLACAHWRFRTREEL